MEVSFGNVLKSPRGRIYIFVERSTVKIGRYDQQGLSYFKNACIAIGIFENGYVCAYASPYLFLDEHQKGKWEKL